VGHPEIGDRGLWGVGVGDATAREAGAARGSSRARARGCGLGRVLRLCGLADGLRAGHGLGWDVGGARSLRWTGGGR